MTKMMSTLAFAVSALVAAQFSPPLVPELAPPLVLVPKPLDPPLVPDDEPDAFPSPNFESSELPQATATRVKALARIGAATRAICIRENLTVLVRPVQLFRVTYSAPGSPLRQGFVRRSEVR
jgi:hypothetical protein